MEHLERLILHDPGNRGVGALHLPGSLQRAAAALQGAGHTLLLTGFPVGPQEVAETDGPPGALFLGRALERMGKRVTFATHHNCAAVMAAGIKMLGLAAELEHLAPNEPPAPLFQRHRPDLVVAIELPGRSSDGEYYNARGMSISARVSGLDHLLRLAREVGVPTIGVGDGGNEAGMGAVIEQVRSSIRHGERIASVIPADILVATGISNWGAYGMLAALGVEHLHTPAEEMALLDALLQAGALDGVRLAAEATVDGVPHDVYLQVLTGLAAAARLGR